jgi:hypothetical protein
MELNFRPIVPNSKYIFHKNREISILTMKKRKQG